jgi:hypothetical protein
MYIIGFVKRAVDGTDFLVLPMGGSHQRHLFERVLRLITCEIEGKPLVPSSSSDTATSPSLTGLGSLLQNPSIARMANQFIRNNPDALRGLVPNIPTPHEQQSRSESEEDELNEAIRISLRESESRK